MVVLTFADFEHLALQLGSSPTNVQNLCADKHALLSLYHKDFINQNCFLRKSPNKTLLDMKSAIYLRFDPQK
jgi:hypothetical protein